MWGKGYIPLPIRPRCRHLRGLHPPPGLLRSNEHASIHTSSLSPSTAKPILCFSKRNNSAPLPPMAAQTSGPRADVMRHMESFDREITGNQSNAHSSMLGTLLVHVHVHPCSHTLVVVLLLAFAQSPHNPLHPSISLCKIVNRDWSMTEDNLVVWEQ
ncbi:hypothetical protein LX36DRAFT_466254 [Colletotrichum falcatum]|nr:hypothetical protein LX36DRAFT_466254 [Colletotrichum falcatum]